MPQRRRAAGGFADAPDPAATLQPPPPGAPSQRPPAKSRHTRLLLLFPLLLATAFLAVRYTQLPSAHTPKVEADPPPPLNASRIAVCYAGHVGTLVSVYRQNEAAIAALSSVPASYFFTVDLNDDYLDPNRGAQVRRSHEIGSVQPVFDSLRARAVETVSLSDWAGGEAPARCAAGVRDRKHRDGGSLTERYADAYAHFRAMASCYAHVQKDERDTGHRFHYVLALRPDMQIKLELPPPDAPARIHLSGVALALVPRGMADVFFTVVTAFDRGHCRDFERASDAPCRRYRYERDTGECLLIKWLRRANITPSNGVLVNRRIIYPEVA